MLTPSHRLPRKATQVRPPLPSENPKPHHLRPPSSPKKAPRSAAPSTFTFCLPSSPTKCSCCCRPGASVMAPVLLAHLPHRIRSSSSQITPLHTLSHLQAGAPSPPLPAAPLRPFGRRICTPQCQIHLLWARIWSLLGPFSPLLRELASQRSAARRRMAGPGGRLRCQAPPYLSFKKIWAMQKKEKKKGKEKKKIHAKEQSKSMQKEE